MDNSALELWLQEGTWLTLSPNRLLLAWGKRTWQSYVSDRTTPQFYAPDFFLKSSTPWFSHECWQECSLSDLIERLNSPTFSRLREWQKRGETHFQTSFTSLQQAFTQKKMTKAVPYYFHISEEGLDYLERVAALRSLCQNAQQNDLLLYGFWNQQEGILGATPEILFQQNALSRSLKTMACAGTAPHPIAFDLLKDPKLCQEHHIVIEAIAASLKAFGKVIRGETGIKALTHFSHLITPMAVDLDRPYSFGEIVSALHPTPALGAWPRDIGWCWLHDYATFVERGRFGAPFGLEWQSRGRYCYVAIRNVQWDTTGCRIGAGCGIVAQSQREAETNELELKIAATKAMLKL